MIIMHWLFKFKVQIMACEKAEKLYLLKSRTWSKNNEKATL